MLETRIKKLSLLKRANINNKSKTAYEDDNVNKFYRILDNLTGIMKSSSLQFVDGELVNAFIRFLEAKIIGMTRSSGSDSLDNLLLDTPTPGCRSSSF